MARISRKAEVPSTLREESINQSSCECPGGRVDHSLFRGGSSRVTFYYCWLFIHCLFVAYLLIVGCCFFFHHFRYTVTVLVNLLVNCG